uniref:Uncharacterized protein n=1 Tax=Cucumis melo TaxID=3656 RepID=A0A9I9ECX9_CUCME
MKTEGFLPPLLLHFLLRPISSHQSLSVSASDPTRFLMSWALPFP